MYWSEKVEGQENAYVLTSLLYSLSGSFITANVGTVIGTPLVDVAGTDTSGWKKVQGGTDHS